MDPTKARDWVAKQIEEHAPMIGGTLSTATRLADAAAALRESQAGPQVFGLAIPDRDAAYAPLYARALEHLAGWSTVLDDRAKAELAAFMVHVGPRSPRSCCSRLGGSI